MPAFPPAEIEIADLAGFALELAAWGARDAGALALLTPPNPGALAEAQALLRLLGALDDANGITDHGRALVALPVHPRLGHMLLRAGKGAAPLAALLSGRDPLIGAPADLRLRLAALKAPRDQPHDPRPGALARIRDEARRLAGLVPDRGPANPAEAAALAYPDRIGLRRPGQEPRWLLSGGKGAVMATDDPLADTRLIVATDLDGDLREARIRQAVGLSEDSLRRLFGDRIAWRNSCGWSRRDRRVQARQQEVFAALVLQDRIWQDVPPESIARAALDGVRDLGLGVLDLSPALRRLQARVAVARAAGDGDMPATSDSALADRLDDWLLPHATGCRTAGDLGRIDTAAALRDWLGHDRMRRLEAAAPAHYTTPLGRRIPIEYAPEGPGISVRLQEMFGTTRHPVIGPRRQPLRVTLLSPAGRPVQVTTDLPNFWRTSYNDVRKDMRGRYPRHPWPENPAEAPPTTRAKPRS